MNGVARIGVIIGCYMLACICVYNACFYEIAMSFKYCYLKIMNKCCKNKITTSKIVPKYSIDYNPNPYHTEIIV